MKIATLGPQGTYSVQAAKLYAPSADIVVCNTIREAINNVASNRVEQAIIPLENSIHGIVAESLDNLALQPEIYIIDELVLDIHHAVCALAKDIDSADVQKIYSHQQALSQCSNFIAQRYPNAQIISTKSTAAGLQIIAQQQDPHAVAIGSPFAAADYGLFVLEENIEDESDNQTRFVVISKQPGTKNLGFIMVAMAPEIDRPGLLYDILSIIKDQKINIQQIESRPNRSKLGSYVFYLRLEMSNNDERFTTIARGADKIQVTVRRMSR